MFFFLWIFYFYQVRSNLEKIIFTASPCLPTLRLSTLQSATFVFENLLPQKHLEQHVQLGFHPNNSAVLIERWYSIHSLHINHTYEIRLSWPATSPARIYFNIFKASNSSLNFYLRLRLIPDYFSLYSSVMASHPLSFHLFLDQVLLGLPHTLRWTLVYSSMVGLMAWFGIAPFIHKLIGWQIKN